MTEWLSKEKEKEKQKGDIDRRRGRRRVAFFRVSRGFFFRQLLAWESNYMAAAAEDRGVFFFSFDTIETGSEKRKKKKLNAIGERVSVVISGFQLTR